MSDQPINKSLLDDDLYKFSMEQVAWHNFPNVPVRYAFTNRTKKVPLGRILDLGQLREELDHARTLRFAEDELEYIKRIKVGERVLFGADYVENHLRPFQLPEYLLERDGDQIRFEVAGAWAQTTRWEISFLKIVSELYNGKLLRDSGLTIDKVLWRGYVRFMAKLDFLRHYSEIRFSDFGTRRRFSMAWQEAVLEFALAEIPNQLLGTSNVLFAKEFGLQPIGTCAHEYFQIFSGIFHENDATIRGSIKKALTLWYETYGRELAIALSDTFGEDAFEEDFAEMAHLWRGVRQDSGDPFEYTDRKIVFYKGLGIDPLEQMIVYSDGLTAELMVRLHLYSRGRIKDGYGWGTMLTNDLGFPAISIVVKVIEACGHGLVKLSNNIAKAIGKPEDIERYKRIFRYQSSFSQECKC